MSRANQAYEKLNTTQKEYLKLQSSIIKAAMQEGQKEENERHRGKLRGYLECLRDMRIITPSDLQALYLYFVQI